MKTISLLILVISGCSTMVTIDNYEDSECSNFIANGTYCNSTDELVIIEDSDDYICDTDCNCEFNTLKHRWCDCVEDIAGEAYCLEDKTGL